jgi:hypothetical protein
VVLRPTTWLHARVVRVVRHAWPATTLLLAAWRAWRGVRLHHCAWAAHGHGVVGPAVAGRAGTAAWRRVVAAAVALRGVAKAAAQLPGERSMRACVSRRSRNSSSAAAAASVVLQSCAPSSEPPALTCKACRAHAPCRLAPREGRRRSLPHPRPRCLRGGAASAAAPCPEAGRRPASCRAAACGGGAALLLASHHPAAVWACHRPAETSCALHHLRLASWGVASSGGRPDPSALACRPRRHLPLQPLPSRAGWGHQACRLVRGHPWACHPALAAEAAGGRPAASASCHLCRGRTGVCVLRVGVCV